MAFNFATKTSKQSDFRKSRFCMADPNSPCPPCRGLRPGQPLRLHPTVSCTACPGRDGLRYAVLRAAPARCGSPLGARKRGAQAVVAGEARWGACGWGGGAKRAFVLPIRSLDKVHLSVLIQSQGHKYHEEGYISHKPCPQLAENFDLGTSSCSRSRPPSGVWEYVC